MTTISIKTTVEIEEKRVADLLCCAMEGGTGYWAQVQDDEYVEPPALWSAPSWEPENGVFRHIHFPMSEGGVMVLLDMEEDKRHEVTREKLFEGLQKMANDPRYRHHFANFLAENEDAETGDVFLQFAVLGEVVYA